jgi:hypothetical protein
VTRRSPSQQHRVGPVASLIQPNPPTCPQTVRFSSSTSLFFNPNTASYSSLHTSCHRCVNMYRSTF